MKIFFSLLAFISVSAYSQSSWEGAWYNIDVKPFELTATHYVDWSDLLDAPAGKHGFLQVQGEKFQFEDGTTARFWGTNLVAANCFPGHDRAEIIAEKLARMGCNLIRFHHMDAPWSRPNIFGNTGTSKLSESSMDKLDYLIYQLKKRGIYVFMDLLVHRDFPKGGDIKEKAPELGGKQVGLYADPLIDQQKQYARDLLTHYNTYTDMRYVDDPVIVGSEIINESTIITHWSGSIAEGWYKEMLIEKWEKSEFYSGDSLTFFDTDWSAPRGKLSVRNPGSDVESSLKFYADLEQKYFNEMREYLQDIGIKYPITGSNMPMTILTYLRNNAQMDFIAANEYWDHPKLWMIDNDWSRVSLAPINNISMIDNLKGSSPNNIARYQAVNKPMSVTEWNACYPNEYRAEGVPMVMAYSSLQGVDMLTQFTWDANNIAAVPLKPFDISTSPCHMANWVAAAPAFLRGYIKESDIIYINDIEKNQIFSPQSYDSLLDTKPEIPFMMAYRMSFDEQGRPQKELYKTLKTNEQLMSTTGELILDQGIRQLIINAEKIEGVVGKLDGRKIELSVLGIEGAMKSVSAILVSADDQPLKQSKKMYLVLATNARNEGSVFKNDKSALLKDGSLPVQAQVFEGRITLKNGPCTLTTLNPDGSHGEVINANAKGEYFISKGRSFVYEIAVDMN